VNPFRYDGPVDPADLIDREPEAAELLDRAHEGHNARLVAPRRYGKTSLLKRLLADVERDGLVGVYVNFFGVLSLDDVADRVERAYTAQLKGPLGRWFAGVSRTLKPTLRAGGGPMPASAEVTLRAGQASLLDRLAVPAQLHAKHGRRVVVVFDEFQDVLRAGEQTDAIIRSEIEQHSGAASYVFAGSQPGMMDELFGTRRRAFYGQAAPIALGELAPADVADYVGARFEATGRDVGAALGPLLDLAGGHPQRTMLLAHHLWRHTGLGESADSDAWLQTLIAVGHDLAGELTAVWSGLTATQQRILTAVAENAAPLHGREVRARHNLPKTGANLKAVAALIDAGELVPADGTVTGYRVVDPLLAVWLRGGRDWPYREDGR
jgi:hypothetical protein